MAYVTCMKIYNSFLYLVDLCTRVWFEIISSGHMFCSVIAWTTNFDGLLGQTSVYISDRPIMVACYQFLKPIELCSFGKLNNSPQNINYNCNRSWQNSSLCMSNMISNFFGYLIGCCSLTIHVHKTLPLFSSSKTFCQNLPEINKHYICTCTDCTEIVPRIIQLWIIDYLSTK